MELYVWLKLSWEHSTQHSSGLSYAKLLTELTWKVTNYHFLASMLPSWFLPPRDERKLKITYLVMRRWGACNFVHSCISLVDISSACQVCFKTVEKWQAGLVPNNDCILFLINNLRKRAYRSVGDTQNPVKFSLVSHNAVMNVFLPQSLISCSGFSLKTYLLACILFEKSNIFHK